MVNLNNWDFTSVFFFCLFVFCLDCKLFADRESVLNIIVYLVIKTVPEVE